MSTPPHYTDSINWRIKAERFSSKIFCFVCFAYIPRALHPAWNAIYGLYGKMPSQQHNVSFAPSFIHHHTARNPISQNLATFLYRGFIIVIVRKHKNSWMFLSRRNLCECVNCEIFSAPSPMMWSHFCKLENFLFSSSKHPANAVDISDELCNYRRLRSQLYCYHGESGALSRIAIAYRRRNAIFMEIWWYDEWK